jgi:hypothetical protein
MASYGVYRAKVVNTKDPLKQNRLVLKVPSLLGSATTTWATPQNKVAVLPSVGDLVFVNFQGGSLAHPVWWGGEPDVSAQIKNATDYTNTVWTTVIKPYVDNADAATLSNAETYAYDQSGHANAATTTSQTVSAGTSWADIVYQTATYSYMPGVSSNPFNTQYFYPPFDGIYVYSGIAHLGAFSGWVGIRCASGGGAVIAAPPPFDGSSLFTTDISVSGVVRLTAGSAIKIQLRSSNGVTINGATFDVALTKKL